MADDEKTPETEDETTTELPGQDGAGAGAAAQPTATPVAAHRRAPLDRRSVLVTLGCVAALAVAFGGGYALGQAQGDDDRPERPGFVVRGGWDGPMRGGRPGGPGGPGRGFHEQRGERPGAGSGWNDRRDAGRDAEPGDDAAPAPSPDA